jgi:Sulfotransferase domain
MMCEYAPPMAVFALWSAPRARSTAFFRSMVERGDMTVLHEPFSNLKDYGQTSVDGQAFSSPATLLAWLSGQPQDANVFLKETMDHQYDEVLADQRFLAGARHAFLIRRPEEIAASYYALFPPMTINAIGMERLCQLQAAIHDAEGGSPIVIDADDLVTRPAATMAAYCAAVGLPFNPQALTWQQGERPEWRQSARWHADASASSGFERHEHTYPETVENSAKLARYAAHHQPFYDKLYAQRLDVTRQS